MKLYLPQPFSPLIILMKGSTISPAYNRTCEVRERVRQRGIERERESNWKLGAFRRGGAVRPRRGGAFFRRTSVVGGEREKGVLDRTEKETWEGGERRIWNFFGCLDAGAEIFWRVKLYFCCSWAVKSWSGWIKLTVWIKRIAGLQFVWYCLRPTRVLYIYSYIHIEIASQQNSHS